MGHCCILYTVLAEGSTFRGSKVSNTILIANFVPGNCNLDSPHLPADFFRP